MNTDRKKRPHRDGLYDPTYEHDACGVGFVAHMKGTPSRSIIENAREVLINMTHRGAVGSDKNSGDGAGILTTLPQDFLEKVARDDLGVELPPRGLYSAGLVFLPNDETRLPACLDLCDAIAAEEGQNVLGWRDVPRDNSMIGPTARASEPVMKQVFIAAGAGVDPDEFERKLYVIRKRWTNTLRSTDEYDPDDFFYVCSLSTRVMVYKGMLMPEQLFAYFLDLGDEAYVSHLAMIHSRFSTNTFPSWDRAQPLRFMSHNGEINTLRGNVNKMRAREGQLTSALFGDDLQKVFPIVEPDCSDSGTFDNVFELLLMAGRELPESVMMMIPEAWQHHNAMPDFGKAMYEYMGALMEPWDGPASIVFTDGKVIGAVLDRNGLRPSRYYVTDDDVVVMASETGVLDMPAGKIRSKGRLQPGRMFLVDFVEGRIIDDVELKDGIAQRRPYGAWLKREKIRLEQLPKPTTVPGLEPDSILARQRAFGYTTEHLTLILKFMAENGTEPLGSMGNDTPLACLSEKPRLLYDYFKQLFAQVTNPPIDSIREDIIMSLQSFIGPEKNLLDVTPEHCRRLQLDRPVITNRELAQIIAMDHKGLRSRVIDITYPRTDEAAALPDCLDRITREVESALAEGYGMVVLSDRATGNDRIPVSALLAVGAVHHDLTRKAKRTQIGIVVESGEPREVHHFCTLFGFGADAVNPYLAFEAMWNSRDEGIVAGNPDDRAIEEKYLAAIEYGMRKVFGKMGISTLESYKAAQIFEAVGLAEDVIDRAFVGTASRIKGVGLELLAEEARRRHAQGWPERNEPFGAAFINTGDFQWRAGGEKHMWDPSAIAEFQRAVRNNDRVAFSRFSAEQNSRNTQQATIRGLLRFKKSNPIPLSEVEPVEAILKRFATGAMSYGSISSEAHETLALAMNRIGGKSNTGEGGEDPERFERLPNGDSKRSAIKQIASGRFGVTIEYLTNADEIQIKMAQGAKPGEGGELPGHKVFDHIAKTRYSTPGVGLISPPPHHDIYSIEDLAQLIFDLKNANPRARISVKLVSEVGVGTVAAGVAKAHADHILVSGHDGGTGASPLTGIKHAGLPWELGLAETHRTLVMNDLRSRVTVQTDGQIKTGRDVVIAALFGAEECGFATSALIAVGCIMMRKCEKNTCPVGIATQDALLRKKFTGKPEHVQNFLRFVAEETREIMAELGFRRYDEMVGRVDVLEPDDTVLNWKSRNVDLSALLSPIETWPEHSGVTCCVAQDHGIADVLDRKLITQAEKILLSPGPRRLETIVRNTDRAVGTMLSHHITRRWGRDGVPDETLHVKLTGSAGQSFGAWLAPGITLELEGDANDYVGKGLSGGTIVVYPPKQSMFVAEENIVIGNVALYGAIRGHGFFRGVAAERFAVRNSGANVVVEGVGDHGCEYMTGGRAVILGETGRNFAAGMSGGVAYVWDRSGKLASRVNPGMVELDELDEEDATCVQHLVRRHHAYSGSSVAAHVVSSWSDRVAEFVKVISPAYRRVLELQRVSADEAYSAASQSEVING
ncbi:MAG: glutamate synthase large subunit [Spirochaetaceae bacterium]|nr:MAG: glutamate synthase large subunit [Spirochaetaceae bacterium]